MKSAFVAIAFVALVQPLTDMRIFAAEEDISTESPVVESSKPAKPVEPAGLKQDRILASQLVDSEARWLKAGKTEFLGIYNADSSGNNRGSLLILAAPGHSAITPGILPKLAADLSTKGWHTLGISLPEFDFSGPAPPYLKQQSLEKNTDDSVKPDSVEASETPKINNIASELPEARKWYADQETTNMSKLLERILAAEAELFSIGDEYKVLAQGVTAELLLELINPNSG